MEAFVDVRARNVLIDVMYDSNSVGMIDDDFRAEHSVVQERADDASVAIDDDPEDDGPKARAAARDPGGPRGRAHTARPLVLSERPVVSRKQIIRSPCPRGGSLRQRPPALTRQLIVPESVNVVNEPRCGFCV